jgi:hypothetical protein
MLCHPPMRVFCSLLNSLYSLSNVAGFTCFSNCEPGARRLYLPTVRIWPRISPPGETVVCTFA